MGDRANQAYQDCMRAFQVRDFARATLFADRLVSETGGNEQAVVLAVRMRLESGRFAEAAAFGEAALLRKFKPSICGHVGFAYEGLGDAIGAERCFARAKEAQPTCADWHLHHAAALLSLRREMEALIVLRQGCKLAPSPNSLLQLADLELTLGDAQAALECAGRAVALDAGDPACQAVAAKCASRLGLEDEAEHRWTAANATGKSEVQIGLLRGAEEIQGGKPSEGIRTLRNLIERHPECVHAYAMLADSMRVTGEDTPLVQSIRDLLLKTRIDSDRASLHYSLGKACSDLQDWEGAMREFDEGNRLERKAIEERGGFKRDGYAANTNLRIDAYDADTVRRLSAQGDPSDMPIFVVGMIRSGTTLAEQILSSHPTVNGAGELSHWLGADIQLISPATRTVDEAWLRRQAELYGQVIARFAHGSSRVVDKQPGNLTVVGALHSAFPNARIIHMRRNPADTAISIWMTRMQTSVMWVHDKANIVFAYREYERLMDHWRRVVPADRFLDVSYEELVLQRERISRRMIEFCGLPWSDDCLEPERNTKLVTTPSVMQVRQPVYATSIDRWRRYEPWLGEFRELVPELGTDAGSGN